MPAPKLFEPVTLGPVTFTNRIVVAPMCQYTAQDGSADPDWHLQHLTQLGMSGAALVVVEATAVERHGRITHGDLGLYSDANEAALARVLAGARRFAVPGTRFGIQLAHAGRKASTSRPWEGGRALAATEDPWLTSAPSAIPFDPRWHTPQALDGEGLARVRDAFVQAARRAVRLGFDEIELHVAHGYLLHEFLTPFANQRDDAYGGSRDNRMRFPLEVLAAVREAVPASVCLGFRISGTDWTEGGWTIEDTVEFAVRAKAAGYAFVCVSSGGAVLHAKIPIGPGYQLPLAAKVRAESGLPTRAVGMIVEPAQAEAAIASGQADQVALARAFLDNPRWPWHAAQALGTELTYPQQYERARPTLWPGAALARRPGEPGAMER